MKATSHFIKSIPILLIIGMLMIPGCTNSEKNASDNVGERTTVEFSSKEASEVIEETGKTEWTYVSLGDSVNMSFPSNFANLMEEDLGIDVVYLSRWIPDDHSSALLDRIRTNESLREDLRSADIITIEIPWHAFERPGEYLTGLSDRGCEGLTPEKCLEEAAETYMEDTNAILDEVVGLCDPSETLIRTMDTYQFFVSLSKEAGSFKLINQYWRECNENLIRVSAKYNIPTVRVYDALMGESGVEDPRDSNLVTNGKYLTEEGAHLVAEMFRDVGYYYAPEK